MRLLYITNTICGRGGLERVLSVKTDYLVKHNYEVFIITLNQKEKTPDYSFNTDITYLDIDTGEGRFFYVFRYLKGIKKYIRNVNPSIIIVCDDGLKGLWLPYFVNTKISFIYERHTSIFNTNKLLHNVMGRFIMRLGAKKYDKFVVLTKAGSAEWFSNNVQIIPNLLPFYPQNISTQSKSAAIAIGAISYVKAHDMLVDIWKIVNKNYPNWNLCIYGAKTDFYTNVKNKIKENYLENVIFLNEPVNDVMLKYLDSSMFLMTSRKEGLPMVMMEAMSCGLPCISFDCPTGPAELIQNDYNGYLIPFGDLQTFADKVMYLIENEEKRQLLGRNARNFISKYSVENIMRIWIDLFDSLIQNKK